MLGMLGIEILYRERREERGERIGALDVPCTYLGILLYEVHVHSAGLREE